MKKRTLLVLAALLACGMTFAQGTKEAAPAASGPTEIGFWSLFTGGDGEFFDAMVDAFNASQSDVVMKNDTVKFDNYYTKLTTALAAKNAPDVVVCHQANLMNYVPNGAFLPLDDYVSKETIADYPAAPLDACRYEGKLYALPLDVHPIVMYYNTDILKEAGITSLPKTADEFLAAAKQVKEKTGKNGLLVDNTTGTYKAYTLFRLFYSMVYQQGGTFLTDDNKKAAFDTEAGAKALDWLKQGVIDGTNPNGLDYDAAMNMFKLGEGAFYFNGVWATGILEQVDGLHFKAAPLPAFFGTEPWAWGGSHTLAVPVQKTVDENKVKAAVKFIEWMTAHGEMWAKAGHIPPRDSVHEKAEFKALPYRADYAGAAGYVKACPTIPAWEEIYGTCSDLLEAAVTKNQDTKTALDNMAKTVDDILAKY